MRKTNHTRVQGFILKNDLKHNICNYTFSRNCKLKQHTEIVHEEKKPHKCSICDRRVSVKSKLNTQTDSVHEKKKPHKHQLKKSRKIS